MIKLFDPVVHEEAISGMATTLRSGWIGLGPMVERFEGRCAAYLGVPYAVAFNSATAALYFAVEASEIEEDSYVITTPNTFVSTNHVILKKKALPIFADIQLNGNMDLDSVERLLAFTDVRENAKAIMAVHYAGRPLDLERLYDIALRNHLEVIEDCAHAFGSVHKEQMVGVGARYACYSFHAVKTLALGDGGLFVTDDFELYESAKQWRWLGITRSTSDRSMGDRYAWNYDCDVTGEKSHMNDITARLGLGQLEWVRHDIEYRRRLVETYLEQLSGEEGLQVFWPKQYDNPAWHIMLVVFDTTELREKAMNALKLKDIQFGLHYKPNYMYPMYECAGRENGCAVMEEFYQRAMSLPLHLKMVKEDVVTISRTILESLAVSVEHFYTAR